MSSWLAFALVVGAFFVGQVVGYTEGALEVAQLADLAYRGVGR